MQNVSINNLTGHNVQIGNGNTLNAQSVAVQLGSLIQAIEQSGGSAEDKKEAKSCLRRFLEHPLTAATLGAVAPGLIDLLK